MKNTKVKNLAVTTCLVIIVSLAVPSLIALASSVIGDNVVITNPTEQLRLGYDANNYTFFTSDSSNNFSILTATGTGYQFGIKFINNPDLVSEISGGIVMGASHNSIDANSPGSVISGGGWGSSYANIITKNALANIGGGYGNQITSTSTNGRQNSVISGGSNNLIFNVDNGVIIGGDQNYLGGAFYSAIGVGSENKIDAFSWSTDNAASYSFIGGGVGNKVGKSASVMLGGSYNELYGDYSVIAGGSYNISGIARLGTPDYSSILGGYNNILATTSAYSIIGGRKASSQRAGNFIWADSNDFTFTSTTTNETAFRSTGGVRFVTAIDGSGNPTKTTLINSSGDLTLPNKLISSASSTPATAVSACTAGTIVWNTSYIYVCVANNTWKRSSLLGSW